MYEKPKDSAVTIISNGISSGFPVCLLMQEIIMRTRMVITIVLNGK